ncbi:MAG: tetratricopeptide repeat protein [Pseudomonadota bacterium]
MSVRLSTIKVARLIGRKEFDAAIELLRSKLKGDASDQYSFEMIAYCCQSAGRSDDAIASCRAALKLDPQSYEMHALLAQLLADQGAYEDAAIHALRGLEYYPEPMPEIPKVVLSVLRVLGRFLPRLNRTSFEKALADIDEDRANWFRWATEYLRWYDRTHADQLTPPRH